MLGRIPASCLIVVAACYSPPKPDCGFVCGPGGACPESYHCAADNHCHLDGTPATLACAVDAGIDILLIDVPIPPDTTRPAVVMTYPGNNDTNVNVGVSIAVQFSEDVTNVNTTTFTVSVGATPISGTVAATNAQLWKFLPDTALPANTVISAGVTTDVTDLAGNSLEFAYGWSFTTAP